MDLVVTYEGEYNMMYLAATPGDFSGVSGVAFGSMDGTSVDVKIGDIDGDGAPDIAVATDGAPNVVFFGDASLAVGGTPAYATLGQNAPTPGTHSPGTASGPWGYSTIGPLSEATTGLELGDVDEVVRRARPLHRRRLVGADLKTAVHLSPGCHHAGWCVWRRAF